MAEVLKGINKLSNRNITQSTEIPVNMLKEDTNIFRRYVCPFFNVCVDKSTFPFVLKHTDITPVFKDRYEGSKENY